MHWSPLKKFAFRWLSLYLFLFMMSNQFILANILHYLWMWLTPLLGQTFFQVTEPISFESDGSGDSLFYYLSLLAYALVALLLALVWTALDRNRKNYEQLLDWLIILIRYYLITQMLLYGLSKVFYLQFRELNFSRLIQSYGDSSPMGLLWTFMGYSKGYTMFSGFGELLGGLLLVSRRTTLIGAFVVLGVMANVMTMNFCYDVPVKILATHLVLLALLLIAMDGKRVWQFFFANEATEAIDIQPHFSNPDYEKGKNYAKWIVVLLGLIVGSFLLSTIREQRNQYPNTVPLYGLYNVNQFVIGQDTLPPLLTDTVRWRRLIIEEPRLASIYFMDDSKKIYSVKADTTQQTLTFKEKGDSIVIATFNYELRDTSSLQLTGQWNQDSIKVDFIPKKKTDFTLIRRQFNWINEVPFDR